MLPTVSKSTTNRRILLHICCGPCATYPVLALRQDSFDAVGYFYNPNIHPYSEHELRLQSLQHFAQEVSLPLVVEEGYDRAKHLLTVARCLSREERCAACYRLRLARAARHAHAHGFDEFTTTLLVSPYQLHDVIVQEGTTVGVQEGVSFLYRDFRVGWPERGRFTKQYGLYRQRYCGCVYSECEAEQQRSRNSVEAMRPPRAVFAGLVWKHAHEHIGGIDRC